MTWCGLLDPAGLLADRRGRLPKGIAMPAEIVDPESGSTDAAGDATYHTVDEDIVVDSLATRSGLLAMALAGFTGETET